MVWVTDAHAAAGNFPSFGNSVRVSPPADTVVTAGETVHLRCTAHPDDMVRWYRGNESKPDALCIYSGEEFFEDTVDVDRFSVHADHSTGVSELLIKNVRPEDVGVYMCTGIPSNARSIVKLDIVGNLLSSGNSMRVCPADTVVTAGETVHLRCTAHPDDMIRWYRGNESKPDALCIYSGEEFFEDTVDVDRFNVRADHSTGASELLIKNVRPEDVGVYMCAGIPSNARAIVKLDIVEPLIDLTASKNLASHTIARKCLFKYYGPIKPTAEWLDLKENRLPSSFEESTETVGLVTTSTNDPSAAQCRLSFHLSSCERPGASADFGFGERSFNVAPEDVQPHAETMMVKVTVGGTDMRLWAWSASAAAVLFALSTLVMCCVKTRRRRVASCEHFGVTNKVHHASHGTITDKPRKPKCAHERDGDKLESAYEETQVTNSEYEDLKFDVYTQLVLPPIDDK